MAKPPKPAPKDVPESKLDHRGQEDSFELPSAEEYIKHRAEEQGLPVPGAPVLHEAAPLDSLEDPEAEEVQAAQDFDPYRVPAKLASAGGVGRPPEPEPPGSAEPEVAPVGQYKGYQDLQDPNEGNLGKPKKIKFVRGIAPGTRPTY